jgi:hypothetical protein
VAGPGRWADASELRNSTRPDLPKVILLRLTDALCGDLGVEHPDDGALVANEHALIKKFVDENKDAEAIDKGVPLQQVPGKGLYRIKRGEWRGVTWADKDGGVVWLCRAVALGSFPHEDLAYDALAALGDDLFPSDEERESAAEEWATAHVLRAIQGAMQEAHDFPNSWQVAEVNGEVIARAHVEQIEEEGVVLAQRFLIVISKPPVALPDGDDWLPLVVARVLPTEHGNHIWIGTDSLPPGAEFQPGREFAVAQETLPFAA